MELVYETIRIGQDADASAADREWLSELTALSEAWEAENCCPSYTANRADAFCGRDVYVCLADGHIAGYALGHFETLEKKTSYNTPGEKAFELDELYVRRDVRHRGAGAALFRYVESAVAPQADLITLFAVSDRYLELLRFYIDELGMTFNSAHLVKRMKQE